MNIKNIIFDLGGVLLNLDFEKTFRAFEEMGVPDFQAYFQQSHSNPLFAQLEQGKITPSEFYEAFRLATGLTVPNRNIEVAWNAMLLDFRKGSMEYLAGLKGRYRLFLLSNTNQIHLEAFRDIHFRQYGNHGFDDHFEKAWYSHEIGFRKPNVECYLEVLNEKNLNPTDTIFIDDTLININGAADAGLHTLHLLKGQTIEETLPAIL
jgi:putative hydrolase of the HAD superfamily